MLHSFHGSDGSSPEAPLLNINGVLYGTTRLGGARIYPRCRSGGCGVVFAITPSGTETVLYAFKGGSGDGKQPYAGLTSVNGKLYGATYFGAVIGNGCLSGCGTVFAITPSGSEIVLHRFGGSDGINPMAGLIDVNGTLYGTTYLGGAGGGTVFAITPSGTETVLHRFGGSDGDYPYGGLINVNGMLYGTTTWGGANNGGTVFTITPSGTETVLHNFGGPGDGVNPEAQLIDVNGTLYGTTYFGGANRGGTVFSITPSGTETVLYRFKGGSDGANPIAGLVDVNGTLYGTTYFGGANGGGTVFAITPSGTETVLHTFGLGSGDGSSPQAGLIAVNGTLYGTTFTGGAQGLGTVFSLTPTP